MKTINERLGIHLRLKNSIVGIIEKAEQLEVPFFQLFFIVQSSGKMIKVSFDEINYFLHKKRVFSTSLFCHGSYWINLSSLENNGYYAFEKEILMAKKLEFSYFVLHAGTAKGASDKKQGIDKLVKVLNRILKQEKDIVVLLENTCHGNLSVGSDIEDFALILENINKPERLGFCIDTAHAYSFGYNIVNNEEQDKFINFLDRVCGIERIKLIHLNDTKEKLGSLIDRHSLIGEGLIGLNALKRFVTHPKLAHVPLIMELPELSIEQELLILNKIRAW